MKRLEKFCVSKNLKNYFYLYHSRFGTYKALLHGKYIPNIKHKYLTHQEIISFYKRSNSVIDYPMNIQSGFTMRTFETLGAGLKLITSNVGIKTTDFYDPKSILHIDRVEDINIDFINRPQKGLVKNIDNYHIDKWIQHILTN